MLVRVELHEQLDRPRALRPTAKDGGGNPGPPQGPGNHVGGHLSPAQGPRGKVPERGLAFPWLVHGERLLASTSHLRQVGGVGCSREGPNDRQVALPEEGERRAVRRRQRRAGPRWPFIAGHVWPSGSMGLPQNSHRGRPAAATAAPCRERASICSLVAHIRMRSGSGRSGNTPSVST